MICPKCGSNQLGCIDSRKNNGSVRRRRVCRDCYYRFSTMEISVDEFNAMISKEKLMMAYLQQAPQVSAEIDAINQSIFPNGECK